MTHRCYLKGPAMKCFAASHSAFEPAPQADTVIRVWFGQNAVTTPYCAECAVAIVDSAKTARVPYASSPVLENPQ